MTIQKHHSFIKRILGLLIIGALALGIWHIMRPKEGIYPYDPAIDRQFIVDLFKDKEEWYWLMSDYSRTPIEHMIDNRSPGDREYNGKLNVRTYRINNKPVGFSASYNKELLEGSILFISVHKDHRRKGIARKLTLDAMDQLQKGGAEVIRLWTRADNVRSRSLYDSLGYKIFWTDGAYVRYEKYLKMPASNPAGNPVPA